MSKVRVVIIAAILTVILTGLSIYVQNAVVNNIPKVTVYIATADIQAGNIVNDNNITSKQIDLTLANANYITIKSDIVNKVAKNTIYNGDIININRVTNKDDQNLFIGNGDIKRFSIPTAYIDDPYSLTFRKGDFVDIIFTDTSTSSKTSDVVLKKVLVVGAIDQNGTLLTQDNHNTLATAILFQSITGDILTVTSDQYKGKFKFIKYPDNIQ